MPSEPNATHRDRTMPENTQQLLQAINDAADRIEARVGEKVDELGAKVDRLVEDGRKVENRIQAVEKDVAAADRDRARATSAWEKWRDDLIKQLGELTKRVEVSEKDISNWRAVSGVLFALTGLLIGIIKLFH